MANTTAKPNPLKTTPKEIITFHGITFLVVEHEGKEYVQLRKLSDLAGLTWKMARKTALHEENVVLFGTIILETPNLTDFGNTRMPKNDVYILFEGVTMYLAQISVRNMKAKGNIEAAEALLLLQVEWRKALHDYETKGIAVKTSRSRMVTATLAKIDSIKDPELKRIAAMEANDDFGIDIQIGKQKTLMLEG